MPRLACPVIFAAVLLLGQPLAAQSDVEGLAFFESKVRPLLVDNCYSCHSAEKQKKRGGLELDTRGGWEKGGDSGPALVPGDAAASLLVKAVRYTDHDLQMPPKAKLSDEKVATLEEWVRRGAPDPRQAAAAATTGLTAGIDHAAARRFWSFQPLRDQAPPALRRVSPPPRPLDAFVFARLEEAGLDPAPEADRRTLLRRLHFDLIGLPPSEAEMAAFLADPAPDAYEKRVEAALASPRYGERQARFWLDLARYADSNGLDENLAMANAWRWRDWVVSAFNADIPYDRFVTLQVAGDLLPPTEDLAESRQRWTATGFLVLGPKMLAEQDKEKLQIDVVDEQLDVLGKAVMGLSLGCARCHDHKFDPITQTDYYALAGVFRSTRSFANTDFVSAWNEREIATEAESRAAKEWHDRAKELEAARNTREKDAIQALRTAILRRTGDYLVAGARAAARSITIEAEEASRTNLRIDDSHWGSPEVKVLHTNQGATQFAEFDVSLPGAGEFRLDLRYASGEERPLHLLVDGRPVAERVAGGKTGGFHVQHQRWQTLATLKLRAGRNTIRLEREGPVPHLDRIRLAPAGASPGDGLLAGIVDETGDFLEKREKARDPLWSAFLALASIPMEAFPVEAAQVIADCRLLEGGENLGALLDGPTPDRIEDVAARIQTMVAVLREAIPEVPAAGSPPPALPPLHASVLALVRGPRAPLAPDDESLRPRLDAADLAALAAQDAERKSHDEKRPREFDKVLSVQDAEVRELPLHVRGSHLNLGPEKIARQVPAVFTGIVPAPVFPAAASGRLEFARWMVHPDHPLTARVLVNRVWQQHFGRGLVASTSNFGMRGEAPSHPELLDWLAREFIRSGWSIKALHRLIVDSATYRMSSALDSAALLKDPENRLLHRAPRRRLDADQIRDALLATSGRIDLTLGGTLLQAKNAAYVTNDQSANEARYDAPRRTLYLPIIRNAIFDFLTAFDFGDASIPQETRATTVIPHQALFLMNSPFVLGEAEKIAGELLAGGEPDDATRISRAWRRILLREPGAIEAARARDFLAVEPGDEKGRRRAWQGLCQVLLASNEFLHLD